MTDGLHLRSAADGLPPEVREEPVAESEVHFLVLTYLVDALRWLFRGRADVLVEGNMAVQWDLSDLRRHVAPDVFVALGVPGSPPRRSFATWEEPSSALDLVIELTSESTRDRDLGEKMELYRDVLGVREYVLFDPFGEWLSPRLQLHRRVGEELRLVEPELGVEHVRLESIDADLVALDHELRLRDRRSGALVPSHAEATRESIALRAEAETARGQAEAARGQAEAARDEAAAAREQVARLEAELRRLRGEDA